MIDTEAFLTALSRSSRKGVGSSSERRPALRKSWPRNGASKKLSTGGLHTSLPFDQPNDKTAQDVDQTRGESTDRQCGFALEPKGYVVHPAPLQAEFMRQMAGYAELSVHAAIVTSTTGSPATWIDGMAPAVPQLAELG